MIKVIKGMEFQILPKSAYDSIKLLAKLSKVAKPIIKGFSGNPLDIFMSLDLEPDELVELCEDIVKDVTLNSAKLNLKDPGWSKKIGIIFELCFAVLKEEYESFLDDMGLTLTPVPEKEVEEDAPEEE